MSFLDDVQDGLKTIGDVVHESKIIEVVLAVATAAVAAAVAAEKSSEKNSPLDYPGPTKPNKRRPHNI